MKLGSWVFYCFVYGYLEEALHTILSFLFFKVPEKRVAGRTVSCSASCL